MHTHTHKKQQQQTTRANKQD